MAFPFRAPRSGVEAMQMLDAAAALRAAGRVDSADAVEAAVQSARMDPSLMDGLESLRGFSPRLPETDGIDALLRRLAQEDMPTPETSFPGYARGTDYDKANSSFNKLRSGSMFNLRNQDTPLNRIRQDDILTAAQDNIARSAAARAEESKMAAAAVLGAAGLGGMIADSTGRMTPQDVPMTAEEAFGEREPIPRPADPVMDYVGPDIPIDPVEPVIPQEQLAAMPEMALLDSSPMDTADLVGESRPIPDSTPVVPQLTPEEIEALRGNVVSIRDAKTGQAMDSFYPPESEEYKREQRMKLRYPQLRR